MAALRQLVQTPRRVLLGTRGVQQAHAVLGNALQHAMRDEPWSGTGGRWCRSRRFATRSTVGSASSWRGCSWKQHALQRVREVPTSQDASLTRDDPAAVALSESRRAHRVAQGPDCGQLAANYEAAGQSWALTCGFARGQGRGRTADLPLFRRTLVPTELPARARRTIQEAGECSRAVSASTRSRPDAPSRTPTTESEGDPEVTPGHPMSETTNGSGQCPEPFDCGDPDGTRTRGLRRDRAAR